MITPNYNWFSNLFWKYYSRRLMQTDFETVVINGEVSPPSTQSVLLLGNHFSWHDGFIAYYLNNRFLHRQFHVIMLEEQLRQNMILRSAGAFSVNRQSREMLTSLQYATQLLSKPQNMLTLYPQGRIESMHTQQPTFEKGWYRILQPTVSPYIVFYIAIPDYLSHKKPILYIYLTSFSHIGTNFEQLKVAFLDFYQTTHHQQSLLYS